MASYNTFYAINLIKDGEVIEINHFVSNCEKTIRFVKGLIEAKGLGLEVILNENN